MINRTGGDVRGARNFAGAVGTAAFYESYIRREGFEKFRPLFFQGQLMSEFERWRETDEGKAWAAWHAEVQKQR